MSQSEVAKLDTKHFYMRRLHSLLGLLPVSVFVIEHMIANSFIMQGPEAYNGVIALLRGLPFVVFLEVMIIGLPLLFHAAYGIHITLTSRANVINYGYWRNWMYFLQRVSGIIALIFIAYHVWEFRIASSAYGFEVTYGAVAKAMHHPLIFWFYAVGMAGTFLHFANGLWLFCITWGITVGPKSQKVAGWIFGAAGLALFFIGIQAIWTLSR
ncbi:MAG: succinate dehydrogenase cytochrome b558 subunit [Candidatus Omnitrophica bacterium]|nr:succinate dehydrogenase cytochrome b558 subunit [Candidatus Omnitrophota bacterium]